MLRITIHERPEMLTLQLEGKLAGTWVAELQACFQNARTTRSEAAVRIDLREVTYVDACGKAFLAAARAQGVELVASGCCMRAIVAELAGKSS